MTSTTSVAATLAAGEAPDRFRDPLAEPRRLGLERHAAELDSYGFTIVEPDRAAPPGFADALLRTVLAIAGRRAGRTLDPANAESHAGGSAWGQHLFYLLLEDPIFEQAMMNETVLALITYLLGESCVLSSMNSILKGPGADHLILHSDSAMVPAPYPAYAQVANATWLLTDYDRDRGALAFWPGSHKFCRPPTMRETADIDRFAPVTAPAGSLVIWHGNTWHGAFPRQVPGLRVNLILYFCRIYMQTQEWYRERVSEAALARNPVRFRHLVGLENPYPFGAEGAPIDRIGHFNSRARTQGG
ncbi:phytanoyl-CoA dioxygenase family protein [Sphingomonas colocasiae]|uniref:Phytanoyl-CoA dioxygenase family protein n=1 Tax=Sphingomonas colocasiae TaxID=1848973 RepID=A0ABS7PLY5_9SPHN|nr:phytanoyl-CoA dioxygenase family protein [Sphingomonas colocasiae]MBY8822241.1 phytanoyl-CoA dioxygenase family protein [Sphingomonas colocasiae]